MTHRFPPPGYAEVAVPPARCTLADCQVGDTVAVLGGHFYLGEFRRDIRPRAQGLSQVDRYAALWASAAAFRAGLPFQILAASRSHYLLDAIWAEGADRSDGWHKVRAS